MQVSWVYNKNLPIFEKYNEIVHAVRSNQVVIVAGETGCGKTTQLPLMCLEARGEKQGKIAVTQPRRIAAISLAKHVAARMREAPSGTVGYKVRFHQTVNSRSRIVFMTDGILLAETVADPALGRYGVIIIDEAHERTINIDFLIGYLRSVLPGRPELRLVIASATIDTKLFSRAFNNAPVLSVSGRLYPVEIRYEPVIELWKGVAMRSHIDGVIHAVLSIVDSNEPGDILAFLPTVDDILECGTSIEALTKSKNCEVLRLYGRMNLSEQERVFTRGERRRVILATTIAETSITVPNIRFVVDTGLARCMRFDPNAGINRMPVERISRASADQRAGRCGRVRDGICIRLFSEVDYLERPRYALPEIRRANLAGALLRMAYLGIGDARRFPFLQQPSPAAISAGYRQLRFLGAFDKKGNLTRRGKAMARLPLDPAIARMLLHARDNGAFHEAAVIASALSVGELWSGQSAFSSIKGLKASIGGASDFSALLDLWRGIPILKNGNVSRRLLYGFCEKHGLNAQRVKEWTNIHRQLLRICRFLAPEKPGPAATFESVHKSLLCAFAGSLAVIQENGLYRTAGMHDIAVSPGSRVHGKRHDWVLFHDIVETKRPYGRYAAEVKPHWIKELFPNQCRAAFDDPRFDPDTGAVVCLRSVTFNGLPIVNNQRFDYSVVKPEEARDIFIDEALVHEKITGTYAFIEHNKKARFAIDAAQRKLRARKYYRGDGALALFYDDRLHGVASAAALDKRIGREKSDRFLRIHETDLLAQPLPDALSEYPDTVVIAGAPATVSYVFAPGADEDGATVTVSMRLYAATPLHFWEWLLPVFRRARIGSLARENYNGDDETFSGRIDTVVNSLKPGKGHFLDQALPHMEKVFGCIPNAAHAMLRPDDAHLWLRISVIDEKGIVMDSFRPPWQLPDLPRYAHGIRPALWEHWCEKWEMEGLTEWNNHRALEEVLVQPPGQPVPLIGYTAFSKEKNGIAVRVFFSKSAAYQNHRGAVRALLENALNEKIAWAWLDFIQQRAVPYRVRELMEETGLKGALEALFGEIILELDYELPEDSEGFETLKKKAADRLAQAGARATGILGAVLPEYQACTLLLAKNKKTCAGNAAAPARLTDLEDQLRGFRDVLKSGARLETVEQLPRYLKAFTHRISMAVEKPLRYDENLRELRLLEKTLESIRAHESAALPEIARELDNMDLMIGDYGVSLFAHGHVAPRYPGSAQKLGKAIGERLAALRKTLSSPFSQAHG